MRREPSPALAVVRPVILFLTGLNLFYAASLATLLVFSFFIDGWPGRPLGIDMVTAHPWVGVALRTIVVIGIVGAALVHAILRRLAAIVDTVRGGDPFIADNVRRLRVIAWCVLAGEGLRLLVAAIVMATYKPFEVDGFSFAPWLAVLLLFVLAGVFARGAQMRADLEGTV
jgi:hypothetical protein